MRLKQIHLMESGDVHSFIFPKWDSHEAEELNIEPFDVLVKYHGQAGGSSKHPYGEGEAEEHHGDVIQIMSLTANEPVRITAEDGPRLEALVEHDKLHALVIGKPGTGTLHHVQELFPDAVVLKGSGIEKGTKAALQLFNFFDDHHDDDVIIDVDNSTMMNDIYCVVMLKALLDDGIVQYHTVGTEKMYQFHGRIVIVCSDLHQIDDSLEQRLTIVDLTKDKTYPKGTALQDIPGWKEDSMKFFEDEAHKDFTGTPRR